MKPFEEPILISKPFLAPLDVIQQQMREIWASEWLTNSGPKVRAFQAALEKRLQIPHASLLANGTLAMELGLRAFDLPDGGEVITMRSQAMDC